jgi:hypothetical protein
MKRFLILLLLSFSTISLISCAAHYITSSKWKEYELPPSKIVSNGDPFFGGRLNNGSTFSVYYDRNIIKDGEYYYNILMQDFGWQSKNEEKWEEVRAGESRRHKLGHIYCNAGRGVALYFHPGGTTWSVFKLKIRN